MLLEDTTRIHSSPEAIFAFFQDIEANYMKWHADHVLFKWIDGNGLMEGSDCYFEEYIGGKLLKKKLRYTKIIPNEYIEFAPVNWLFRWFLPKMSFAIRREGEYCDLIAQIVVRAGPLVAKMHKKEFDAVRRHMREEGENLKALLEQR